MPQVPASRLPSTRKLPGVCAVCGLMQSRLLVLPSEVPSNLLVSSMLHSCWLAFGDTHI